MKILENKLCMELSNSTSDAELKELFKNFCDEQLKEYLSDWKWYSNLSEDCFALDREIDRLKAEQYDTLLEYNKLLKSLLDKQEVENNKKFDIGLPF